LDTNFDLGKVKEMTPFRGSSSSQKKVMEKLLLSGSPCFMPAESKTKALAVFVIYQRGDLLVMSNFSAERG